MLRYSSSVTRLSCCRALSSRSRDSGSDDEASSTCTVEQPHRSEPTSADSSAVVTAATHPMQLTVAFDFVAEDERELSAAAGSTVEVLVDGVRLINTGNNNDGIALDESDAAGKVVM